MASEVDHGSTLDSSALLAAREAPMYLRKSDTTRIYISALRWGSVFLALLVVAILLQWAGRAYSSEFSSPDESAHLVTGLMIRDYITTGFPRAPVAFAEEYYVHYPKVAFGMWGPLLHITEGVWTLVFPTTRSGLLLLIAVIFTCTAVLLYRELVAEFGTVMALAAALGFLITPVVQRYTGMIMADGLVALMDFCAAMAFGRYLNTRQTRYSVWFGIFASLSILTKGNGMALVLLPGFAILFTRQFNILKERSFWIGVAIVACIAGPWQYYSAMALVGIAERKNGWVFAFEYARHILSFLGWALLPIVLLGVYDRTIAPARNRLADGKWVSAAALVCSVWAFHCTVPGPGAQVRYLIAVGPPMLMFLVAGIHLLARWIAVSAITPRQRGWAIAAVVITVFLTTGFSVQRKRYYGFDEVAQRLERPEYKNSVLLVSSVGEDQDGEGMFISEIAMREKRPLHIVLRASKMLSQSDWMGGHYKLLYNTPQEVMNFLRTMPVEIVVIHDEPGLVADAHHKLLQQAIAEFSQEWEHMGTYPQRRAAENGSIDVYRLKSPTNHGTGKIRIDLPYTLKRQVEFKRRGEY